MIPAASDIDPIPRQERMKTNEISVSILGSFDTARGGVNCRSRFNPINKANQVAQGE